MRKEDGETKGVAYYLTYGLGVTLFTIMTGFGIIATIFILFIDHIRDKTASIGKR